MTKQKSNGNGSGEAPEIPPIGWTKAGLPIFMAVSDDTVNQIRAAGYDIFYILAEHKVAKVEKRAASSVTTWEDKGPRLFKVMGNLVGISQFVCEADEIGLAGMSESATFTLPKIPFAMVAKLDRFFRTVDDKLGTEAIVVLTFDTRFMGSSDGWDVLVPEQHNTGGSCKYDPASVVQMIPDEDLEFVRIVGTAHSHPEMSAFASHIDHKDQLSNDGLHITFGWLHAKPTEYYIELQLGDTFECTPHMVFADIPPPPEFPEEKEWLTHVKKGYPASNALANGSWMQPGPSTGKTPTEGFSSDGGAFPYYTLPVGCPDPKTCVLVTNVVGTEAHCPVCESDLVKADFVERRCYTCGVFFAMGDEPGVEGIIAVRAAMAAGRGAESIEMLKGKGDKPVRFWHRFTETVGAGATAHSVQRSTVELIAAANPKV